MATLTPEQIEQKKQQLKQLAEEVKVLKDELVEAGAWPMDEDDLDKAAGGIRYADYFQYTVETYRGPEEGSVCGGGPPGWDPSNFKWKK